MAAFGERTDTIDHIEGDVDLLVSPPSTGLSGSPTGSPTQQQGSRRSISPGVLHKRSPSRSSPMSKSSDGRNWFNFNRATQGKWLEANKDVDAGMLIQNSLDVTGLTEAVREIIKAVLNNGKNIERSRDEMDKLHKSFQSLRKESTHLEKRCNELEGEVVALRTELKVVHENREALNSFQEFREVHELKMIDIQQECRRIDACKIDASSPQLEADSRKYALDTVKSFFTLRNKEIKSWIEKKILALRTTVTQDITDQSEGLMKEISDVQKGLVDNIECLRTSTGQNHATHESMFADCAAKFITVHDKFQSQEACMDSMSTDTTEGDDRLRYEVRMLYTVLCTTLADLESRLLPGWDQYQSTKDVEVKTAAKKETIRRYEARLASWKALHKPMPSFASNPSLQVHHDGLDNELHKKIVKLKESLENREDEGGPKSGARTFLSAVKKAPDPNVAMLAKILHGDLITEEAVTKLIASKVFSTFRMSTDTLITTMLRASVEDIKDDLARESATITKELKTKINAQKCVQLIHTNVGEAFADDRKANIVKFENLDKTKLSVERAYEMMREKADLAVLAAKADRHTVNEMFEFVNTKVGVESSDDAVKKAIRSINSKLDDISRNKVDRTDPELTVMMQMLRGDLGAKTTGGGNTEVNAPTLSLGLQSERVAATRTAPKGQVSGGIGSARIVKHAPSPPPHPADKTDDTCLSCMRASPDPMTLEDVVRQREREKQEQQHVLHLRQVASGTNQALASIKRDRRTSNTPVDVDGYITGMCRTASVPKMSRTPETQVLRTTDPRMKSQQTSS